MTKEEKREYHKRYYQDNKEDFKKRYQENKEITREYDKKRYQEHKEKRQAYGRQYYQDHKEECKERSRKWAKENPERMKIIYNKAGRNKLLTPRGKINDSVRSAVRISLKGNKAGRGWESLVGYTLKDLMSHLESLFDDQMDWENYGKYEKGKFKWQIDHRKPLSLFHYKTAEDPEFKECWALKNLQPMEAVENIKKSNHYLCGSR